MSTPVDPSQPPRQVPGPPPGYPPQPPPQGQAPGQPPQEQPPGHRRPQPRSSPGLAATVLVGCLVAVTLGAYSALHEGTGYSINLAGFSSGLYAKSWLTTLAALLALVQLWSAGVMWGRFMSTAPSWIGSLHRWSGRLAVLASTPVAIHCLYAVGFSYSSPRTLIHSLVGCLFWGAFVSKMLSLTRTGMPARTLPILGGIVFTGLIVLWLTSALWLFDSQGLKF